MRLASRMDGIGTETAFEAAARARALEATGRDVIHLEIGEPDFDTPRNVSEAAARALLDDGMTHYTPATGIAPLKQAIVEDVRRRKGIDASADRVIVTPGAKPIMFYAMLALLQDGDEAIYPNPGFPIYESMIEFAGARAVAAQLREADDFRMDLDELRSLVTDRTRLIVINSPHNPTGATLTDADLGVIAELAVEHDLVVLADEIYGRLQYEGSPTSIATLPGMADRTITLDGFSKTYAMTGWRLGYGIVPEALVGAFGKLVINSVSCTNAFAQAGAVEALTGPQDAAAEMREEFIARRSLIVEGLNRIDGVTCIMPHGAFYAFPNVSSLGRSSQEIADHLLYDAGVCVLAGTAFGRFGEGYLRFSYANSRENLSAALERVASSLARLQRTGSRPAPGAPRDAGAAARLRRRALRSGRAGVRPLGGGQGRHRREHRPDAQLPAERPSRRVAFEGPPLPVAAALRRHALGHSTAVAPVRRPLRTVRGAHGAARLRHACRAERDHADAARARREAGVRLPGRRALGADLGRPHPAATPRRPARARRDGGQDPLPEVQHRAVGPRHAARGGGGCRAQACRPGRGQGLRRGGRGRPHPRRQPRDAQLGLGPGLDNLVFLVDWNDYGIDDPSISSVVPGTPESWFGAYDWRVTGTMDGSEWAPVSRAVLEAARGENPSHRPSMAWFRTRKGRGYGKYDNKSHGSPHAMNAPEFWAVRRAFMEKYGVTYAGIDEPAPADPAELDAQMRANFEVAMRVLHDRPEVVDAISDRLVAIAASVPEHPADFNLGGHGAEIFEDPRITDYRRYPAEMWKQPGEKAPNRAALATWGSWVNSVAKAEYGRPLVIACSADLAESTNIAGFAKGFGDLPGWGWYNRDTNPRGALLPQEITEFTNAGITVGIATVNLADDPMRSFNGFWAACSTYGSFSYLKYGPMRLFSQLAQDTELKVGKVLWIAGHSGPETAEDSRTHFGIFSPGVTQLFPEGHVIDLHPWEHNEVPVMLAAALATDVPIVALHLTRPSVEIPDRDALGMAPHWDAARGAYLLRDARAGTPSAGTVYVQGTVTTANVVKALPELDRRGVNVRIVAALSPQLFAMQDAGYRDRIRSEADRWSGMAITNRAFKLMRDWVDGPLAREYSLSSDWDDRWRTGGTVDEVMDEAHLGPGHILEAIVRYADDREERHRRLRELVDDATRDG